SSSWWKSTARPMPHFSRPTSPYFQTYTPYVPTMSYNHMKYNGDIWAPAVKPSAGCSWKTHRKDTKCLVLSKDFKFPDESMVLLRVPRKHNLYTINLNNLCPIGYKHVRANQSAGTQRATTNPADSSGDEVDDSLLNYADKFFQKELARLKGQEKKATSDAESLVKNIFKYLKGQPNLGLWYPRESPFVLEAYSDNDYAGENKDRKSTTGGCQFLGRRLISWQCKKQTIVATSSTEAEYVAAANCSGQVCWIQN
nr:uncharacterized mitochondrial protein AtMg00810-like [Tanacetum cinerariifolium]